MECADGTFWARSMKRKNCNLKISSASEKKKKIYLEMEATSGETIK